MREAVYQTICPGCSIGCGLYIRENDTGAKSIDFMKSSPANLGKLCRFGMKLPSYYSTPESMVDASSSGLEEAIEAAASRLKDADDIVMVSVGNTTTEEHLAFTRIADTLDTVVNTGVSVYSELSPECHPYLGKGVSFADIEKANRIALFIDPYIQYPLLVRRLLTARDNGASIVSVGTKDLHLADESKFIGPEQYEDELGLNEGSIIIADVHPHTDPEQTKQLLNLTLGTGARILFMKPFVNTTGVHTMSKGKVKKKGLSQIMEDIDQGKIKTLLTLDSDLTELMPDTSKTIETLNKLDNLIVITSRDSPVNKMANVVIATEPLYLKAGSLMNVEGRLQENSASGIAGTDAMSALNEKVGGEAFDYQTLHETVVERIANERTRPEYCKVEYKITDTQPADGKYNLTYLYNPFMWSDQADDNNFVMVSMNTVKNLGLKKGGMITLASEKSTINMKYRIEDMPDNLILTAKKLPVATGMITEVTPEGY